MMNVAVKKFVFLLLSTASLMASALEYDQNIDISLSASTLKSVNADQWQPQYAFSPKLNLWLYPNNDVEVSLRYGVDLLSQANPISQPMAADYLIGNVDSTLWSRNDNKTQLSHQLEQLMVTYWADDVSISIGRQAISFGIAKVYSPADVIQPTSVDFSQSGYRQGVDALRTTWYIGAVSELTAGLVVGDDQAVFARWKTNTHSIDVDLTTIQINETLQVASFGVLGSVGVIGLWQETAWLREEGSHYFRSSVGADSTFFDDLYVMAEYHFNGIGKQRSHYGEVFNSEFYQLGAVQPIAKQYLSLLASKPLNALLRANVNWVTNLSDQSGAGLISIDASVSDNTSASVSLTLPHGDNRSSETTEYGVYPLIINASLNWVF